MNIEPLLGEYFIENYNARFEDAEIFKIDAKELLVSNRIDLFAKYIYIESKENPKYKSLGERVYYDHLEAISGGTFEEPGEKYKNSYEIYKKTFDTMIEDIKKNGFDDDKSIIPIGNNNVILDGAHRVAACAYFNKKVNCIRFNNLSRTYNYLDFKKAYIKSNTMMDIINKYITLKKCTIFIIWPKTNDFTRKLANDYIDENYNVVYKDEIKLNKNGIRNLMVLFYGKMSWTGNLNNGYVGLWDKIENCYSPDNNLEVIIVDGIDIEKNKKTKKYIRTKDDGTNDSIHSTDSYEECIETARTLLNSNSINFLNNACPFKYKNSLKKLLSFRDSNKNNMDDIAIDGSTILALYGIRDTNDIDCLLGGNAKIQGCDCHNDEADFYKKDVYELIYNTDNYFYYLGMKFITIDLIRSFKKNRAEKKDLDDVYLIDKNISNEKHLVKDYIKEHKIKCIRKMNAIKNKLIERIVCVLKKINMYNFCRKICVKIGYLEDNDE